MTGNSSLLNMTKTRLALERNSTERKLNQDNIENSRNAVAYQVAQTYKVFVPDTLLVPIAQYEGQLTRSMGDGRRSRLCSSIG